MLCPQILLSANIFEELIEFALWPLAILIFAVVFILGGYVTGGDAVSCRNSAIFFPSITTNAGWTASSKEYW